MSAVKSKKRVRRRARVAILAGGVVAALGFGALNVGTAAAAPLCTGSSITGQGASLQKIAQQNVWKTGFESGICNKNAEPKITYNSTGSGAGLVEWNHDGTKGSINTSLSYISTDDAPTAAQIGNIQSVAGGAKLAVVPVTQTAIAIVANLPAGCELEGISNTSLAAVMEGRITSWSKVEGVEGECESPITRVVRKDASGTTYQFKNYLFKLFNKGLFCTTGGTEGKATWQDLETIGTGGKPNIDWPETCPEKTLSPVVRAAGTGGGELVKKVNTTDGSIGYAALPDAVNNKDANTVILQMQNNGQKKGGEANYAAANVGTVANCSAIAYKVPKVGTGLEVDWSQVFGAQPAVGGLNYPLCTLTYSLVFNDYSSAGFTEGQEITVRDYIYEYIVQSAGQSAINGNYYASVPSTGNPLTDVLGASQRAAKTIAF
jgi:ABC-type phosphate transport system substrate-binding protein